MASLRDVLNHAGKKVRIGQTPATAREGLALRREGIALIEPRLEPRAGDTMEFLDSGERFRLESSEPQEAQGKIDHYRARIVSLPRG